jgi:tRNA-specific 2-thiouridylase
LALYTIGQRKGLGISGPEPFYVLHKDIKDNALIIGPKSQLGMDSFSVDCINWISGDILKEDLQAEIKVRYKSKAVPGKVMPITLGKAKVFLTEPLPDVTPGQAAVFYQGDQCLGGGIILSEEL